MQSTNLFWAGLATLAAKRFDRDLLLVGQHDLTYSITGKDEHEKRVEKVSGVLTVSPSQSRTNKVKPPMEDLVAAILYRLAPKKRGEVIAVIASETSKGLVYDDATQRLAAELISCLSTTATTSVRGSLAFGTQ